MKFRSGREKLEVRGLLPRFSKNLRNFLHYRCSFLYVGDRFRRVFKFSASPFFNQGNCRWKVARDCLEKCVKIRRNTLLPAMSLQLFAIVPCLI